jgi:hypothetical protein
VLFPAPDLEVDIAQRPEDLILRFRFPPDHPSNSAERCFGQIHQRLAQGPIALMQGADGIAFAEVFGSNDQIAHRHTTSAKFRSMRRK